MEPRCLASRQEQDRADRDLEDDHRLGHPQGVPEADGGDGPKPGNPSPQARDEVAREHQDADGEVDAGQAASRRAAGAWSGAEPRLEIRPKASEIGLLMRKSTM